MALDNLLHTPMYVLGAYAKSSPNGSASDKSTDIPDLCASLPRTARAMMGRFDLDRIAQEVIRSPYVPTLAVQGRIPGADRCTYTSPLPQGGFVVIETIANSAEQIVVAALTPEYALEAYRLLKLPECAETKSRGATPQPIVPTPFKKKVAAV